MNDLIARSRTKAQARLEDVEWLISWNAAPDEILRRVGFPSYGAVEAFCRRHNRPDLHDYFAPYARTERYAA